VNTNTKGTTMEKTAEEYRIEAEEQERKHDALMLTLSIPADDDRGTYTNRRLQAQWVEKKEPGAITGTSGWTAGAPEEVLNLLNEGDPYILETDHRTRITGWIITGVWYDRKTDEDLAEEHRQFVENMNRERREALEKNEAAWQAEEDALPEWARARLRTYHERGGDDFKLDGWSYELMVCQLAVEYAKLGEVIMDKRVSEVSESEEIKRMAREYGTSGNQHGIALALAKAHLEQPERTLADTPSALTPLTGRPFFEKD